MADLTKSVEPKLDTIPRRKLLKLGWAIPVVLAVKPPTNVFAIRSGPPPCATGSAPCGEDV